MNFKLRYLSVLFIPFLIATSAGKGGGGQGSGFNPNSTTVQGELVYKDAAGLLSTVPGTVVDPATGAVEGPNFSSVEDETLDTNGMGTWTNNIGTGTTINNCSTSNSTTNDNAYREIDIYEDGVKGTPGKEVMEQCIGKTEALDEKTWYWSAFNTNANVGANTRVVGINTSTSLNITQHAMISSYPFGVDSVSGSYRKMYIKDLNCTIEAATGFPANTCLEIQLEACDVDGGIVDTNDCTKLTQYRFARDITGDCTSATDKVCNNTFPCRGTPKSINTLVDVPSLTVTTGSGSPDIFALTMFVGETAFTADGTTGLNIQCSLRGDN